MADLVWTRDDGPMPARARSLYVFARDRMSCELHLQRMLDQDDRYADHRAIFLTSRSAMQGRRFERGDEIHYLNGWGASEVAPFIEQSIDVASLTWVPTKTYFDGRGDVMSYTQGHTPPPPMHDTAALEAWLVS